MAFEFLLPLLLPLPLPLAAAMLSLIWVLLSASTVEVQDRGARSEHAQAAGVFHSHRTVRLPVTIDGVPKELVLPPDEAGAHLAKFCAINRVLVPDCLALARAAADAGAFAPLLRARVSERVEGSEPRRSLAPLLRERPSSQRPLAFLHLEKCAGTTIRGWLSGAAAAAGLVHAFVPGITANVPSLTFTVPNTRLARCAFDLVAGHFDWSELQRLDEAALACGAIDPEPTACVIMVRDPLARVESYYRERVQRVTGRALSSLAPAEIDVLLRGFRATVNGTARDHGMADALHALLCAGSVATCRSKTCAAVRCPLHESTRRLARCTVGLGNLPCCSPHAYFTRIANTTPHLPTRVRVSHACTRLCRELLVEDMAGTLKVFRHWLPALAAPPASLVWENRAPSIDVPLSEAQRAVVMEHNQRDLALYVAAKEIMFRQLTAVNEL